MNPLALLAITRPTLWNDIVDVIGAALAQRDGVASR